MVSTASMVNGNRSPRGSGTPDFCPAVFQGVEFRSTGDPVLYVSNPAGVSTSRQRDIVDAVQALNRIEQSSVGDAEITTRISQYEMAFRMQSSVPELMNVSDEPQHVLDMYGTKGGDGSFAANCLLARRLAERGVRFIQLYHRDWDHHGAIKEHVAGTAAEVDRGAAALLSDLKARGMLDDTIVVFGSELVAHRWLKATAATIISQVHDVACWRRLQARIQLRSHRRTGISLGRESCFCARFARHVALSAGIDHQRFTAKFQGLDSRLTGVEEANVVHDILA